MKPSNHIRVSRPAKAALTFLVASFVVAVAWLYLSPVGHDGDLAREGVSSEKLGAHQPEQRVEGEETVRLAPDSGEEPFPDVAAKVHRDGGIASIVQGLSLDDSFIEKIQSIASSEASNYLERHAAVQSLSRDLSEHEVRALYRFLLAGSPDADLLRRQDRALKNDVINSLRVQKERPSGLSEVLIAMFEDLQQDEAVRDYALQQMRTWHGEAALEDQLLILETLARALEETGSSLGGTALLALRQIAESPADSRRLPDVMPPDVTEAARTMVHSHTTGERSRITAMQVLASKAPAEVFDTAAEWALDSEAGYPRRLSAIAALGASESEDAAAVLAQIKAMGDPYLQTALQKASERLRQVGIEN